MLTVRITPGSSAPIYQQIITQMRHAMATGVLAEGELLPSVRLLAEQLLINPNTVAKAYADLSRDGLVEAVPGRGLAVAPRRAGMGLTVAERLRRIDPFMTQLLQEAVALDLTVEQLQDLLARKWKALTPPASAPTAPLPAPLTLSPAPSTPPASAASPTPAPIPQ